MRVGSRSPRNLQRQWVSVALPEVRLVPRGYERTRKGGDLPRDFHPALIRAAAIVVMLFGALFAMGSGMPDPIAKIVSA